MKLIEPTMEYEKQIIEYRRDFLEFGGSMDGCGSLRRFETVREWLDQVESFKRPETVPEGYVVSTQFIYVREEDEKIVGMIQIRHYLSDYPIHKLVIRRYHKTYERSHHCWSLTITYPSYHRLLDS